MGMDGTYFKTDTLIYHFIFMDFSIVFIIFRYSIYCQFKLNNETEDIMHSVKIDDNVLIFITIFLTFINGGC